MARNMYSSASMGTASAAKAITPQTNHLSWAMVKICWSAA